MLVKPLSNQTLLDIALQYLGDAGQAYVIAEMNGIEVDVDLEGIEELRLPDEIVNEKLVQYYELNKIILASKYQQFVLIEYLTNELEEILTNELSEPLTAV